MAEGGKFIIRPKVRFCQWENDDDDDNDNQELESYLNKPTIKNIVTIEKPYKIIDDRKIKSRENSPLDDNYLNDNENYKNSDNSENCENYENSSKISQKNSIHDEFNNYTPSFDDSSFSSWLKSEISHNPKIIQVDVHAEDLIENNPLNDDEKNPFFNKKEHLFRDNLNLSETKIFDEEKNENSKFEMKNLSKIEENSLSLDKISNTQLLKIPENLKINEKKLKTKLDKKQLNSINRLTKVKSPKKKNLPELTKFCTARPLGFIQRSSKKPIKVAGIMPCLKAKIMANGKISPIKKNVLRNIQVKGKKNLISNNNNNNLQMKKELNFNLLKKNEEIIMEQNIEKLSKPKYNSIMNTINKLKQVQKENIVTDVEHLPPIYKSLVNGKVASSLDFPPDEAIFKNLINLSIDETQLPMRITRSKDPEPRQRDAVPKLSDFFQPKYADEYCTAVCAKPRNPEQFENWNAFRISDKIRSWKWNMDFVH
ncbi:repetitive organellar protein-like [Leptopilina boulardi]|uniref:repetitive organellar protein-like n=1 Tax=Leptopilina boulardi TaxID=63433 RepID=UPI0021F60566|nr:repetitive organellar protein-like [Leptopilina boulardi]